MKKVIEWVDNNLFIKHWVEQNANGELILFREIDKDYYQGEDTVELENSWTNNLNVGKEIDSVVAEMYDSCDTILYCEKELCKTLSQHTEFMEADFLKEGLNEYIYKHLGREDIKEIYAGKDVRFFFDMDGTLFKWTDVPYYEKLYEKGYFMNLEPNIDILNTANALIEEFPEQVFIASKYLTDSKYAYSEKMQSVLKNLPNIKRENIILIPNDEQKTDYIPEGVGIRDILIDDYTSNLLEWQEAGGSGIKYLNGINHTRATWKGMSIHKDDPKQLENLKIGSEHLLHPTLQEQLGKENVISKELEKNIHYENEEIEM